MSVMTENRTETYEGVEPRNVRVGDRLQFMTRETGFNGRGLYSRIGTVVKVTAKTVHVDCRDSLEGTAVLRRDVVEWHSRAVRRVVTEKPARRPYNAENVQYVDDGPIVTAVWVSDPAIDPAEALENILRQDLPYEVVQVAEAMRHFKHEGADFSGWIISRGNDYSTNPIARKRDAVKELRGWVEGYFTRDAQETTVTEPTATGKEVDASEYEVSPEAATASARDALAKLKATERDATGWKANPIYWVGYLAGALEQTLRAIDKTDGDKAQEASVGTEYGIFEDGVCIEAGFYGTGKARAEQAVRELVADNPEMEGAYEVLEICPDHDEQPRRTCEDCASDA